MTMTWPVGRHGLLLPGVTRHSLAATCGCQLTSHDRAGWVSVELCALAAVPPMTRDTRSRSHGAQSQSKIFVSIGVAVARPPARWTPTKQAPMLGGIRRLGARCATLASAG